MPTDTDEYQRLLPVYLSEDETHKTSCFAKQICGKRIRVWHLLASLLLVLVMIGLLGSFVVVPHTIQGVIDKTELSFNTITMDNISNSTFSITANGSISHSGPFTATISPSGPFAIFYKGYQLGNMEIPVVNVKGGAPQTPMIISNNVVTVSNSSHFANYGSDLLNSDSADWELRGYVNVHALGITFHKYKFIKTVTIPGMKGLVDTQITAFNVPGDGPGYLNVSVNATIFNPSFVSMHVGDVFFDITYENWTIGTLLTYDLYLKSGSNQLSMSGVIQPTNNDSLPSISVFFSQYISGIGSVFGVRGRSGPVDCPEWLDASLQSMVVSTILPGSPPLNLIDNLALTDLTLSLPGLPGSTLTAGERAINMSASVSSSFKAPFPMTLEIYEVAMSANMMVDNTVLGTIITTPSFPSISNQTSGALTFNMSSVRMQIVDMDAFKKMVSELVLTPASAFTLSGYATAMVKSQIGNLVLTNISFSNQLIQLDGFNGFKGDLIKIVQPNTHITNGYEWGLKMLLNIAFTNPSSVHIRLASLSFDYYFDGQYLGNTTLIDVDLASGVNNVVSYSNYVKPPNATMERQFLSAYLQGNDSKIELVGNGGNIELMASALAHVRTRVLFPGQQEELLAWSILDTLAPPRTTLALHNPTDSDITVYALTNFQIYTVSWEHYVTLSNTSWSEGFPIGAHGQENTQAIDLDVTWKDFITEVKYAAYLIGNHTLITAGEISYKIEDYGPVIVDSQQYFTMVGW